MTLRRRLEESDKEGEVQESYSSGCVEAVPVGNKRNWSHSGIVRGRAPTQLKTCTSMLRV